MSCPLRQKERYKETNELTNKQINRKSELAEHKKVKLINTHTIQCPSTHTQHTRTRAHPPTQIYIIRSKFPVASQIKELFL